MKARAIAALVLSEVFNDGHSLSAVLPVMFNKLNNAQDKGLIQELCYGVLRWYPRLEWLADQLLEKPLKARDRDVLNLLLVGIYQLLFMRIPPHASVNETVAAASELGKPWACPMINAVLRALQRDRDNLSVSLEQNEQAATAHPDWMLEALRKSWPDDWRLIIEANNQRPPMHLRVNKLKVSRATYLQTLTENGINAQTLLFAGDGIGLEKPVDVSLLPGFDQGWLSVQDAAAQLAGPLLNVQPGQRVLDACAAPGGKTAHILELQPDLEELVAVDIDSERLQRIAENLKRLDLEAQLICGDAAFPESWWDGRMFDRILLDAPCSATGVIRRHPDIKRLRRPDDMTALDILQRRILIALWPLLKPGGMLLYVTCSVLPRENDEQIINFLSQHEDAFENKIAASWGRGVKSGRQILAGEHNMDGFYFVTISKQ